MSFEYQGTVYTKRLDLIGSKIAHIEEQIQDIREKRDPIGYISGAQWSSIEDLILFLRARRKWLVWARSVDEVKIIQRIQKMAGELTSDELSKKYGILRGLPVEKARAIMFIVDMEYALGEHPVITGYESALHQNRLAGR